MSGGLPFSSLLGHIQMLYFRLHTTQMFRRQDYKIDDRLLHSIFVDLQRQLHPDKHSTKGKEDLEYAEQHSARVNEGYAVLTCPLARAKYMVRIWLAADCICMPECGLATRNTDSP